jgi:hypothetical protein
MIVPEYQLDEVPLSGALPGSSEAEYLRVLRRT